MKYAIKEQDRKNDQYYEFRKGPHSPWCWRLDSMDVAQDVFRSQGLAELFTTVFPDFPEVPYVEVNEEQWQRLLRSGNPVLQELDPYVQSAFAYAPVFTLYAPK